MSWVGPDAHAKYKRYIDRDDEAKSLTRLRNGGARSDRACQYSLLRGEDYNVRSLVHAIVSGVW